MLTINLICILIIIKVLTTRNYHIHLLPFVLAEKTTILLFKLQRINLHMAFLIGVVDNWTEHSDMGVLLQFINSCKRKESGNGVTK